MLYRILAVILVLSALLGAWSYHRGMSLPDLVRTEMAPAGKVAVAPPKINLPAPNPTNLPLEPTATPTAAPAPPTRVQVRMLASKSDTLTGLLLANGGPLTQPQSLMAEQHVDLKVQLTDSLMMTAAQLQNSGQETATDVRRRNPWSCDLAALVTDQPADVLRKINMDLRTHGSISQVVAIAVLGHSHNRRRLFAPTGRAFGGQGLLATAEAVHSPEFKQWLSKSTIGLNVDPQLYDSVNLNWMPVDSDAQATQRLGMVEARPRHKITGEPAPPLQFDDAITDSSFYDMESRAMATEQPVEGLGAGPEHECILVGVNTWLRPRRDQVDSLLRALYEGNRRVLQDPTAHTAGQTALEAMTNSPHADKSLTEVLMGPPTLYPKGQPADLKRALGGDATLYDSSFLKDISK